MSATFMICVHDITRGEVLVKVGIIKFGLFIILRKGGLINLQAIKQRNNV